MEIVRKEGIGKEEVIEKDCGREELQVQAAITLFQLFLQTV
jgi:hypothetical protein